jgi:hypothetical protein
MALARNGPYQLLVPAIILERLSRRVDAAAQGRVRGDPAAPDRRDEIVPADNTRAILDQINQYIEHLRFDVDRLASSAQLASIRIKQMVGENKLHLKVLNRTASNHRAVAITDR